MLTRELNAVVSQRIDVAPGLMVLRIALENGELPDFSPGQFAVLGLPGAAPRCLLSDGEDKPVLSDKLILRAYSIASSSVAREYLEFYITLVHSGALTPRLFSLEIGDRLWLSPKFSGFFTLEEVPPETNLILIATGTGLAPYMSMVRSELTDTTQRRLAIIHGARHSWDLGYRAELVTLGRLSSAFTYIPTVSRPKEEPVPWAGQSGYVQEILQKDLVAKALGFRPAPENTHFFLCGDPNMIEDVLKLLEAEGFREHSRKPVEGTAPGQVHVERYW